MARSPALHFFTLVHKKKCTSCLPCLPPPHGHVAGLPGGSRQGALRSAWLFGKVLARTSCTSCTSCTSTWLFKQGGRELHSASLSLQSCVCQLHSVLHTFTDLFPVQHTSTHFAKDVQFVLHFVLSLHLVMRHNCLKPASTQLRGRVQLNGTRMTSCNVHDTAALTSAVECTAAAILGRPVCRCELHCIAFALCACLAREGIAPRPRCGGGLGLGAGRGWG